MRNFECYHSEDYITNVMQSLKIDRSIDNERVFKIIEETIEIAAKNNITAARAFRLFAKTRSFKEKEYELLIELMNILFWRKKLIIESTKLSIIETLMAENPDFLEWARKHELFHLKRLWDDF